MTIHKAYRRFYDKDSGRVRGSLFYFKVSLRRTSVNGKVKNNYTGHEELFLLLGDMLMTEQALEYLGMETYQSQPTRIKYTNIPFFYAHSKLSKYFVENIDILLKTQYLLSPQMQLRLLEGSYVNPHGNEGNNVETDLVMEHSVRNKKDLICQLGANKTEKAIQ
ncbi:uncharacterized protein [Haliotis cracherodii]|uniref:uncharacterized protein n=1 Tax=Haliotis cracherodii TaxID=6455 RepID=UPI0039E7A1DB